MKQTILKSVMTVLVALFSLCTYAYNAYVGGIYYNLNTSAMTATVTYQSSNYNSYSGVVIIPESFVYNSNTYSVTSIGGSAFEYCIGLTSVSIPNSVTSIRGSAFSGCSGLTSVSVPNSVTSIGDHAFSRCSGLTSVDIPNSVTSIGEYAFSGCSGLTSVKIEDGNETLCFSTSSSSKPFSSCPLETLYLGRNISYDSDYSPFKDKTTMKSITIGNSVTSIGYDAFSGCSGLTSVHITDLAAWCRISFGSNPLSYAHHLYLNGEEVKDLVIPNSVTSISYSAFRGCSGLTSVSIPNSVTSIGESAFSGCSGLTSVSIPNSVTSIGYSVFDGCSGLTSVSIPNSVTSIRGSAFSGCSGLTSVSIPNSVTSIGSYAFYYCI